MVDNLFVFGNGLGRALNNDFFELETALKQTWDKQNLLTDKQKGLILSCLPAGAKKKKNVAPTNEDDLDVLHQVVSACDTIKEIEKNTALKDGWLSPHGLEFPTAVRKYLHMAARCFLKRDDFSFDGNSDLVLPKDFSDSLRHIILSQGAHVATLNYDDLLYEAFVATEVFDSCKLRDGFFQSTFNIKKHKRFLKSQSEGWFLHLHGSPLFVTRDNKSKKLTRAELRNIQAEDSTHLVLTNVKHKLRVIETSEILRAYWTLFEEATKNAKNIIVMGYSGNDTHLNAILNKAPTSASIRVVEWAGSGVETHRLNYWKQQIAHANIEVVLLTSILDFRDWAKTQ